MVDIRDARDPFLEALSGIDSVFVGPGCGRNLPLILEAFERIAVVASPRLGRREGAGAALLRSLRQSHPQLIEFPIEGEPSDEWVDAARDTAVSGHVQAVVSIGGGSALDAGKALAVMCREPGCTRDVLEGVGVRAPSGEMLPWFAAPATAGTGSEASTNAVLSRPGPGGFKKSLRHPRFRARAVFLDPELVSSLPPAQAAASGMDALTQLFESWLSRRCPDDLAPTLLRYLALANDALPAACTGDPQALAQMLVSAFVSGVGLTRAGLGTVHGLAGPIGARTRIPHALACARLFGPWIRELRLEPAAAATFARLESEGVQTQTWPDLADRLGLPRLSTLGFDELALRDVLAAGSDRDSPFPLGPAAWERMLRAG